MCVINGNYLQQTEQKTKFDVALVIVISNFLPSWSTVIAHSHWKSLKRPSRGQYLPTCEHGQSQLINHPGGWMKINMRGVIIYAVAYLFVCVRAAPQKCAPHK